MTEWVPDAAALLLTTLITAVFGWLWRRESNRSAESLARVSAEIAGLRTEITALSIRTTALERTSAPIDLIQELRASMLGSLDTAEGRISQNVRDQVALITELIKQRIR